MNITARITNILGIDDYDIISSGESSIIKTPHNYNEIVQTIFSTVYLRRNIFRSSDQSISFKYLSNDLVQHVYFVEILKEDVTRIIITPLTSEIITEDGVVRV